MYVKSGKLSYLGWELYTEHLRLLLSKCPHLKVQCISTWNRKICINSHTVQMYAWQRFHVLVFNFFGIFGNVLNILVNSNPIDLGAGEPK